MKTPVTSLHEKKVMVMKWFVSCLTGSGLLRLVFFRGRWKGCFGVTNDVSLFTMLNRIKNMN